VGHAARMHDELIEVLCPGQRVIITRHPCCLAAGVGVLVFVPVLRAVCCIRSGDKRSASVCWSNKWTRQSGKRKSRCT